MQALASPAVVGERLSRERSSKASRPFGKRIAWIGGLGISLIALLILAWFISVRETPVRYVTAPVARGDVVRAVSATGTVNPVLTIIVGTYVSGVIQQLYCDFNTEVKQGQICAKIDPRPYQSVVDQDQASSHIARAQLEKDKANLAYAEVNYQRNAKLAEHDYTSKDVAGTGPLDARMAAPDGDCPGWQEHSGSA